MFAVALEPDPAQHDHLIIALDLFEGLLKDGFGVFVVAFEELFKRTRDPRRSFMQAVTRRIVAGPADDRLDGGFDVGAARLLRFCHRYGQVSQ